MVLENTASGGKLKGARQPVILLLPCNLLQMHPELSHLMNGLSLFQELMKKKIMPLPPVARNINAPRFKSGNHIKKIFFFAKGKFKIGGFKCHQYSLPKCLFLQPCQMQYLPHFSEKGILQRYHNQKEPAQGMLACRCICIWEMRDNICTYGISGLSSGI